jgi:hypothetical protein
MCYLYWWNYRHVAGRPRSVRPPSPNRMLTLSSGFQPEPFYLTSALLNETRFHDHAGDSLLSNSASIHDWRNHRSSSALLDPHRELESAKAPSEYTLPVRSTRPIVHQDGSFSSLKLSDSCYETSLPSLITPASSTDTKVRYVILEVPFLCQLNCIRHMTIVSVATDPGQQVRLPCNYCTHIADVDKFQQHRKIGLGPARY